MPLCNPDILIPSCREEKEIAGQVFDITSFSLGCRVIASCTAHSASVNRNSVLSKAESEIVIMVDDDIFGFFDGWWQEMVAPLVEDRSVYLVSSRLMEIDGRKPGYMTGECYDMKEDLATVAAREVPTACIAFRNTDIRFDEGYRGSGFEDNDFCKQLQKQYPMGRVVINNKCQLRHANEMKHQKGVNYDHNREYFNKKWNENR